MKTRALLLWGSTFAAAGCLAIALGEDLHVMGVGYAIASPGCGGVRLGFTTGASLAAREDRQRLVVAT